MIGQILCFMYRLYKVTRDDLGFSYTICAVNVISGYFAGGIRTVGLTYFYDDFRNFRQHLRRGVLFQRDDPESQRIRREHYENNQKFTLFLLMAGFGSISVWNVTDYRMTDQYRIPFDLSEMHPFLKELIDTLYGMYLLVLALHFWIPFLTIRVSLRVLRAELLVLNRAFGNVLEVASKNQTGKQRKNEPGGASFWKSIDEEFRRIAAHHQEILIDIDRIRRLASVPFLAEMFATVSITTIAIFLFMLVRGEKLVLVWVASIAILESYYNSLLVEELEDAHTETGKMIYGLGWPMALRHKQRHSWEYKNAKQTMLIIMARCQQRLRFHCGGLFEMSMETFSDTMKTCYSVLTFMMQMQGL